MRGEHSGYYWQDQNIPENSLKLDSEEQQTSVFVLFKVGLCGKDPEG